MPKLKNNCASTKSGLTQILQRDENGKPKLKLTPLEKTVVNTKTQEDYWALMRVYECGEWKWGPEDVEILPTQIDIWKSYKKRTCISAGIHYFSHSEGRFGYTGINFYQDEGVKIISPKRFYDKQKITPGMINEINQWFDENSESQHH